jgi:hypothetical protein
MNQDQNPDQHPPETQAQKFLKYFSLFMTMVYPAFGIYLLLSSPEQIALDSSTKIILGIMLILYGIFRFYRTYQRFFRKRRSGRID